MTFNTSHCQFLPAYISKPDGMYYEQNRYQFADISFATEQAKRFKKQYTADYLIRRDRTEVVIYKRN